MAQPPADTPEWHESVVDQFRSTGGTTDYYGRNLVLLHHRGARSGDDRVTPITGLKNGDTWLVAASRRGHTSNPSWLYNLLANPDTVIETPDDSTVPVSASLRSLSSSRHKPTGSFLFFDSRNADSSDLATPMTSALDAIPVASGENRGGTRELGCVRRVQDDGRSPIIERE